jgi:hypothetical protein
MFSKGVEKKEPESNFESSNVIIKSIRDTSTSGISVDIIEPPSTKPPDYWLKSD